MLDPISIKINAIELYFEGQMWANIDKTSNRNSRGPRFIASLKEDGHKNTLGYVNSMFECMSSMDRMSSTISQSPSS